MANTINATSGVGIVSTADNTNELILQTNGTNAVSIDSSQNVSFAQTLALGVSNTLMELTLSAAAETVTIAATAATGTVNFDVSTQSICTTPAMPRLTGTDNGVTAALAAGTVPSGQWVYVALVRSGSTTTGYINGSSIGTTAQAPSASRYARVGALATGASYMNGYIQDLRITKGYARTITTPTAAFPTL